MTDEDDIRPKKPTHLGGYMKHGMLQRLGLPITEAADALGVPRPALLNERAHLSPDMAIRIEKTSRLDDMLMRMQNSYDLAQARKRAGEIKVVQRYTGMNTKGRA